MLWKNDCSFYFFETFLNAAIEIKNKKGGNDYVYSNTTQYCKER